MRRCTCARKPAAANSSTSCSGAKAVLAGGTIGRRQLEQLAQHVVAVRLEHDDALGAGREPRQDRGCRRLDVVQDAHQERRAIARQRGVIERRQVDGAELEMRPGGLLVRAADRRLRQIEPVDRAIARKHRVGEGTVAAAEIEHMRVRRDAERVGDVERDLPAAPADVALDLRAAIHRLAVPDGAGALPVRHLPQRGWFAHLFDNAARAHGAQR